MSNRRLSIYAFLGFLFLLTSCKSSIREQEDKIYSRHLQRHVKLTIINTPKPGDKSGMNLLLFNNGDELQKINAKHIIDSLYRNQQVEPLMIVAIDGNEKEEYGISDLAAPGNTGSKAAKYNQFVINELYPFIKKRTAIRKFNSIAICGNSLGGISAFDIAWHNADKINKAGIFSGTFTYADNNDSVNAVFEKIRASRKRPKLQFWLFTDEANDTTILSDAKKLALIIDQKNISSTGDIQIITDKDGNDDHASWRRHFPEFLVWAFGK